MAVELGTRVVDLDGPVRSDLEDWPGRLGLHVQMFEVSLAGAFPYSIGKLDVLVQIAAAASFYSQDRSYPSALLPQVCQASCYCHIDTKAVADTGDVVVAALFSHDGLLSWLQRAMMWGDRRGHYPC